METIIIRKGAGYWDVTRDPWGAVFQRATEPIELTAVEVLDRFASGAPRRVTGTAADGRRLGYTIRTMP
jgi:hypothetical protein